MGWARFDDKYIFNPKILAAGPWAELLDVRGIIWCAGQETDGLVSSDSLAVIARGIPKVKQQVEKLIQVGRWETVDGGWMVLKYLDYNPSREQCEKRRQDGKERAARSREQKAKHERTFASGSGDPRGGDGLSVAVQELKNCELCDSQGFVLDEHGDVASTAAGDIVRCTHQPTVLKLVEPRSEIA